MKRFETRMSFTGASTATSTDDEINQRMTQEEVDQAIEEIESYSHLDLYRPEKPHLTYNIGEYATILGEFKQQQDERIASAKRHLTEQSTVIFNTIRESGVAKMNIDIVFKLVDESINKLSEKLLLQIAQEIESDVLVDMVVMPGLGEVKSPNEAVKIIRQTAGVLQSKMSDGQPNIDSSFLLGLAAGDGGVECILGENYEQSRALFVARRGVSDDEGADIRSLSPFENTMRLLVMAIGVESTPEYKIDPNDLACNKAEKTKLRRQAVLDALREHSFACNDKRSVGGRCPSSLVHVYGVDVGYSKKGHQSNPKVIASIV